MENSTAKEFLKAEQIEDCELQVGNVVLLSYPPQVPVKKLSQLLTDFASQSKPQLNINKIVNGIVDSLGETSKGNDYHIHSVNGNRWITHNEVGSGEPLKQWLKSEIEKHIEQSKPQEITSLEDANKNLRERHSIALDTIEELKEEIAGHEKMRKRAAEVVVDFSNKLSKAKEELEQIKTDTKTVDAVEELTKLRNELFDKMPTGEVSAFALIRVIQNHLNKLDKYIESKK